MTIIILDNDPKSMRQSKRYSKREVYHNTNLAQERDKQIKNSNKKPYLTPKATRVRRKNKTQSQQKKSIKIRADKGNRDQEENRKDK